MVSRGPTAVTCAAVAVLLGCVAQAEAKCTRLAFSVNDHGKDGPTKDAKALLDKYIADWTAQRGIKNYTVGKKDVSCELFLNFIVFDEHTCKAEATVCWGEGDPKAKAAPAAKPTGKPASAAPAKSATAPAASSPGAAQ
jgi:hypothetical protein